MQTGASLLPGGNTNAPHSAEEGATPAFGTSLAYCSVLMKFIQGRADLCPLSGWLDASYWNERAKEQHFFMFGLSHRRLGHAVVRLVDAGSLKSC
jgi:hypothetical protein